MPTIQRLIVAKVEFAIDEFIAVFKSNPFRFFTENDLVCCLHRHLFDSLESIKDLQSADEPLNLIHCEYPTPFRCDMKNTDFRRTSDDEHTSPSSKRKYKRGHYDIVVLNPQFIRSHSYSEVKCQDYDEFKRTVVGSLTELEPMILYGIELVFSRDPIPFSDQPLPERAAEAFVKSVAQDAKKLAATVRESQFMKQSAMLAFTCGTTPAVNNLIRRLIREQFPCERAVRFVDASFEPTPLYYRIAQVGDFSPMPTTVVCRHEAAHALAAYYFNMPFISVEISLEGPKSCLRVEQDLLKVTADAISDDANQSSLLFEMYSVFVAVHRIAWLVDLSISNESFANEWKNAGDDNRTIIQTIADVITDTGRIYQPIERGHEYAAKLMAHPDFRSTLEAVAKELCSRRILTHAEISQIIQSSVSSPFTFADLGTTPNERFVAMLSALAKASEEPQK